MQAVAGRVGHGRLLGSKWLYRRRVVHSAPRTIGAAGTPKVDDVRLDHLIKGAAGGLSAAIGGDYVPWL